MKITKTAIVLLTFVFTVNINGDESVNKDVVYQSALNGTMGGTFVGLLMPINRSSSFILTMLTSPLCNAIPIVLALVTVGMTLKKQKYEIFGFRGYFSSIGDLLNFKTTFIIAKIGAISFLTTLFTYYISSDCISCLKQKVTQLYKKKKLTP